MENPNTWTPTQKIIVNAILAHQEAEKKGVVGHSLATTIYRELIKHGIIQEPVKAK